MATSDDAFVVSDCRGGQNNAAPPLSLTPTQCTSAVNVEWHRATVARKRRGSRRPLFAGDAGWASAPGETVYETSISWIDLSGLSHVLVQSDTHGYYRVYAYASSSWTAGVLPDTASSHLEAVYFNGKLVLAYDSAVPRLHTLVVEDGVDVIRHHGLAAPTTPPTVVESAGAVTDSRKYRRVALDKVGATDVRRSEPSPATVATTLTTEQVSATYGTALDQETHWELQVASDDDDYASWWVVGEATIVTALVDNHPNLITAGLEPAPQEGLFQPFPSVKYLVVDENRLLGAGNYEATDAAEQQKIYFSPVLGDLDVADDERTVNTVDQKDYLYLDGGDHGGPITGFGEPVLGSVIVFKRHQIWKLVRTGIRALPYRPECLSKAVGSVSHRSVLVGEDQTGNPCLYFMAAHGPYRLGVRGLEYLGAVIEDVTDRITHAESTHIRFGLYYPARKQVWWWIALDGNVVPAHIVVFHVATQGWSIYIGPIAHGLAACLAPRGMGAANGSDGVMTTFDPQSQIPYVTTSQPQVLYECDAFHPVTGTAFTKDGMAYDGTTWSGGTAFQAALTTRPIPVPLWHRAAVTRGVLLAEPADSTTLDVTLTADFGLRTESATVPLSPLGTESHVIRDVSIGITAARSIQATIGDAEAVASQWAVDALALRTRMEADS